jgi:hypothetical protein
MSAARPQWGCDQSLSNKSEECAAPSFSGVVGSGRGCSVNGGSGVVRAGFATTHRALSAPSRQWACRAGILACRRRAGRGRNAPRRPAARRRAPARCRGSYRGLIPVHHNGAAMSLVVHFCSPQLQYCCTLQSTISPKAFSLSHRRLNDPVEAARLRAR